MRRAALVVLSLVALGCGTRSDEVSAVIGPEGGTLTVTDAQSALHGVRLDVPAGALAEETTVSLKARGDASGLPPLPTGLAAFEPVLEFTTGAPFQADVTLSFPLRSTALSETQVLSAFRADVTGATWQVVLAKALEDQAFTIHTREAGTWRWGLTLLETVEYQTLKPAMEAIRGPVAWAEAETAAKAEYQRHMAEVQETDDWTNCDSLNLFARILLETRDGAAQQLHDTLATNTACGTCDVTIDVFMDELVDYIQAKVRKQLVNFIIDACDLSFFLDLYLKLETAIYFHNVIERLSCDYECLLKTPPPGLWGHLVTYGVCDIALVVVVIGADYSGCQLEPP